MKKVFPTLFLSISSLSLPFSSYAQSIDSIFTAPEVFITSKIKPTKDFEGDRGNILVNTGDIEKTRQYSIGGMLRDLPGISSQGLGNATRPIIRGMTNSRVKILQNSSSLSDVSEFGEDHIVGYDPMLIDKIEIIKGPATLLYGNNAFAGVVNIINPLISVDKPFFEQKVETNLGYSTSGGEVKTALKALKSVDNFSIRGMGSFLSSGSYNLANSSANQGNSAKSNFTVGLGITYNDGNNFLGLSVDKLEAEYSLPGGEGVENRTSINPTRNLINFKSGLAIDWNIFNKLSVDATISEYNHAERVLMDKHNIEYFNDTYEIKTSFNHRPLMSNNIEGVVGFHYQNLNQGARGEEESNLTTTKTNSFGLFVLEKLTINSFELDLGARMESVNLKTLSQERGFFASSFSSSLKRQFVKNNTSFVGFDLTQRAPNPVELFANGAHHAVENFENGESNLGLETSYNFSVGNIYRNNLNKIHFETYFNYIDDFIAADRDGTTVAVEGEDFNNVVHEQYNALFTGLELLADYHLLNFSDYQILTRFSGDLIKGYKTSTDKAITRVPQSKLNFGLQILGDTLDSGLTYNHYFTKGFLGPHQTRTGGHSRLDFDLTKDFSLPYVEGHIIFTAINLLDTVGRDHLESKKDSVELPGRNFNLTMKVFY